MKKKLFIFLIVTISAISGCLITLGVLAYFALSPNFKYKYVNFDEIDRDVTFENFSVSQELSSSTGNPFLHLKRKGVGFGTIGTNPNGTELIQLFDSNRRMTIMLSFKDEQVDRLALVYDGAGKYGARYDSNDSGWEYAWWTESGPDDIGYFWQINDPHIDVKYREDSDKFFCNDEIACCKIIFKIFRQI